MIDTESTLLTLRAMLQQEGTNYTISDFFRDLPIETPHGAPVDATARQQIATWVINIMEACNYKKEYAAITMSLLDRFVDTADGHQVLLKRSDYQLAALAALYTSVKIHCPQALSPELVAKLSQGSFTRADVERMELRMLTALQWRVNPPTVMDFVRSYLHVIASDGLDEKSSQVILDLASLQAEMSVLDARFLTVKSSQIAFGSLLNAVESIFVDCIDFCEGLTEIVALSAKLNPDDLQDIRGLLYEAIMNETSIELPIAQRAAFRTPINKKTRRESFNESPRSVFEHDEIMVD